MEVSGDFWNIFRFFMTGMAAVMAIAMKKHKTQNPFWKQKTINIAVLRKKRRLYAKFSWSLYDTAETALKGFETDARFWRGPFLESVTMAVVDWKMNPYCIQHVFNACFKVVFVYFSLVSASCWVGLKTCFVLVCTICFFFFFTEKLPKK